MGVLPKIAFLLFAASSMGRSDAHISWKSSLKNLPLYEVGHPHSWQGPSSIINVWKDLDDVWPGIFHDHFGRGLMITNPTTFPQRCVQTKHDQDDNTENEFAMEERKLELRQDELQRDLEDLTRRREDHKMRQSLDRRKEERPEERRHLEEQHWRRREHIRQQEAEHAREERQRLEEQRRMERERQRQKLLEERRRLQQIAEKEQWLRQQQEAKERERQIQEQKIIEERQRRQQAEDREWRVQQQHEAAERERVKEQKLNEERQRRQQAEEREWTLRQQHEAAERERIKEQKLNEERQRRKQAEREKRINEPERRTFEENESAKLQHESSTTQRQSPHYQSTKPESQIASIDIPEGYFPEDIAMETMGRHIYVKGRHVCSCEENCFEREFERRLSLPNTVDTQSLSGSLYPSGTLTIHGVKYQRTVNPVDTTVPVVGVGMKQRHSSSCNKSKIKKSGFKLKKMNARTGEIMEDIDPIQEHYSHPLYESEVDEDGLTIEVVT